MLIGAATTMRKDSEDFLIQSTILPLLRTLGIASIEAIFSEVLPCLISDLILDFFAATSPNKSVCIFSPHVSNTHHIIP